mgnify:CR=1 FL=1
MKEISRKKIKKIISEEKEKILSEQVKMTAAQYALKEIAMQSAILHDSNSLKKINEEDLKKIKSIAEYIDSIFYRTMHS